MKLVKELSTLRIKSLRPGTIASVGGVPGLKIHVNDSGTSRSWILRLQVGKKRRELGLGGFPAVGLAEAREKARRLREQARDGKDPLQERNQRKAELLAAQNKGKTFEDCARACVAARKVRWRNEKHAAQWLSTLERHAFPIIGSIPVSAVGKREVLQVLQQESKDKLGKTGSFWEVKTKTASRVRGRIERVLDWATANDHRQGFNKARWTGYLDAVLAPPTFIKSKRGIRNHPALPLTDVPVFFAKLRAHPGTVAEAMQLLILTGARSGEVRGARWAEVDFAKAVWTVPAERMKAHVQHRIPLSVEALRLLAAIKSARPGGSLIFPSMRDTPLSDMALNAYMRRNFPQAVPHGFRSTFRDWAAEAGYPFEVCEAALAHTPPSKVVSAYLRTDFLEKRREMMNRWAAYCLSATHAENLQQAA